MMTTCDDVRDQLCELADGDPGAIARHAEHLAGCDACRDARHDAARLAARIGAAGADHVPPADLAARVLATLDGDAPAAQRTAAPLAGGPTTAAPLAGGPSDGTRVGAAAPLVGAAGVGRSGAPTVTYRGGRAAAALSRRRARGWLAIGSVAALAAGGAGLAIWRATTGATAPAAANALAGKLTMVERAAADARSSGVMMRAGTGAGRAEATWRTLGKDESIPAGAELRTDERTRAALELPDGTRLVLDHRTAIAFDPRDARRIELADGRIAADVAAADRPAAVTTSSGRIDVAAARDGASPAIAPARFSVTAGPALTAVQVTHGAVVLTTARGEREDVRAGEEGMIERGALAVSAAPGLVRDAAWAELAPEARATADEAGAGLGALRAYKPGESRDRDWRLALARHDVKVRVVGPIARTEITEVFRNDSAATLEGVYQFPLPPDAQIDGLALDVDGGFVDGAFVDKERGARIWRGVIDKATPRPLAHPSQEIIWVEGRWRDPALLDWKRGGRFELRVYPIPAHGTRTIKLAYTQVVMPRGSWRQYSYPLPHSRDGSTVADEFTIDVELRGAEPGRVRTAGYDLVPDPARPAVNARTLRQAGFVPRGDLVIAYRASDGDAELRAWTFAGGAAAAPDQQLATKRNVGIDPRVVEAQRAIATDPRPTAVLALHPRLPRWRDDRPRDYLIVVDGSQSMVGERFARATELATAIVEQIDRRDRFDVAVCDSECRAMGELRTPSRPAAAAVARWLATQVPAGASDVVAALRDASARLGRDREPWILYIGDGFASTGFRRVGDVERALAGSVTGARITAIGIGSDADAAVLQAAARSGGGSYVAWAPGQRAASAAAAALESTVGAALRDATVELPAGLADVAPSVLPTLRAGEEVLIAARVAGEVAGDVVVRGRVAGQPFEQRYPLRLAVSAAAGNSFVPRLWAKLAIDQLERTGGAADRASIVALSQGYGVMSRETSLLVLESQAMFDAFGVDRGRPAATWTGEDALDEVASSGAIVHAAGAAASRASALDRGKAAGDAAEDEEAAPRAQIAPAGAPAAAPAAARPPAAEAKPPVAKPPVADKTAKGAGRASSWSGPGRDWIPLRRVWVRVPSLAAYDAVHPGITRAIAQADAALAASPDSRESHRALVQALSYAGEIGRARDVAERWLARDQLDPQALGYLADLLGRDGQRELALRTLAGLVDLDADRVPLHERLARAYEQVGRLAQACSHRIAIAALQPRLAAASAAAVRCSRALGRDRDAELILQAVPDDARAAVDELALAAPRPAPLAGELVVRAHWTGAADLDVALITPEGTRISWMGGRSDVATADVTSRDREELAVKTLRRGNYLVEISRGDPAGGPVRGTVDIAALGARRSIPFELAGARAVIGRVSVRLEQRFEDLDGNPVQLYDGPGRRIIPDRR